MSELEARAVPARGSNRDAATAGGSRKLLLLAGAAFRSGGRWARQHLYVLLLLTPMVAGMTYMTAGRLLGDRNVTPVFGWRRAAHAVHMGEARHQFNLATSKGR